MKLDAREDRDLALDFLVYLDGHREHDAVAADTDSGWVEVLDSFSLWSPTKRKYGFVELIQKSTGKVYRSVRS